MKTVVIGLLGTVLDGGGGPGRWEKWRPTVSLCQHEDFVVDRLELLHSRDHARLAKQVCDDLRMVSPETQVRPTVLDIGDAWDFQEVYGALHDFARAYTFDEDEERYLVHITTGTHVAQICLFLLTEARYFPARLLQTSPPRKQRAGAAGGYELIDLDLSRYAQIAKRFAREKQESTEFLKSGIDTRNAAFNRMIGQIERVAVRSTAPLLLIGPTGAGKSLLARRIYELKKARHQLEGGEFVEVNCATLRGDTAMSTLFGHVRGAFTGAQTERAGLLRKADKGIVFLDEIGELGLDEQAMLLKAIEEKSFFPMGADKETRSDFQLIAGTNRDLAAAVHAGSFREDLLARIDLWTFRLPALCERREDIEPNVDYELVRHAERTSVNVRFEREARAAYLDFATGADAPWHGNFRELGASITRMATLADGGRITQAIVAEEIGRLRARWRPAKAVDGTLAELLTPEAIDDLDLFDRVQLEAVIGVCRGCRSMADAGRRLFAASRAQRRALNDSDRLKKYLARFGLDWARVTAAPAP